MPRMCVRVAVVQVSIARQLDGAMGDAVDDTINSDAEIRVVCEVSVMIRETARLGLTQCVVCAGYTTLSAY
jgi:hypothetical protein